MTYHMIQHISSIQAIFNMTSFLQSLWIQLTFLNAITFKPTRLEPTKSASLLLLLKIISFDLVTSWSVKKSEVKKLEVWH